MKRGLEDNIIGKKKYIPTRELESNTKENLFKKMSEDDVRIKVPNFSIPIQEVSHVTTYQTYSIYFRKKKGDKITEDYLEPKPGIKIGLAEVIEGKEKYILEIIQEENNLYLVINGIKKEQPIQINKLLPVANKPEIYIYVMTRFEFLQEQKNLPKKLHEIVVDSKNTCSIYETGMPTSRSSGGKIVKVMKSNVRIQDIENMLREIEVLEELNKNTNDYIEKLYGRVIINKKDQSIFPGMLVEQGINFHYYLFNLYEKAGARNYYPKIANYMNDIVNGVRYLHSQKYVHFDLKLDNLIYVGRQVKLIDFGFSRTFKEIEEGNIKRCGTKGYMAPEIVKNWIREIGTSTDIWALGCILILIIGNESGKEETNEKIQNYINEMTDIEEIRNEEIRRKVIINYENIIKDLINKHPNFIQYDKYTHHKEDMMNFILKMLKIKPRERLKSEDLVMPNGVFLQ